MQFKMTCRHGDYSCQDIDAQASHKSSWVSIFQVTLLSLTWSVYYIWWQKLCVVVDSCNEHTTMINMYYCIIFVFKLTMF